MGGIAGQLWTMAVRRRDLILGLGLLGACACGIAVYANNIVRDHKASVREVGGLARGISVGDSKRAVRDQLARPEHGSLRLDEVSDQEWHVGVFSWPSNWMLVLQFDDGGTVAAVRVRAVDGPAFVPAGAPADRAR